MKKESSLLAERLETNIFNYSTIEHLHRYAIAKEFCTGKQVLDIACGDGYGCNLLSEKAAQVIGVDIDKNTIAKAKNIYKSSNIHFKIGSCSLIPVEDNSIDVAVSFETLEHHDQHKEMLSELKRVLKKDGILIISTPDKKYYSDIPKYKNPYHVKEIYLEEFEALIQKHFKYYHFYYQKYIIGSLIISAEQHQGYHEYAGNYDSIEKKTKLNGVYNICVAGNSEINKLGNSFFTGELAAELAIKQLVKTIQQSHSYKLGHFLLYPFRLFKKWSQ